MICARKIISLVEGLDNQSGVSYCSKDGTLESVTTAISSITDTNIKHFAKKFLNSVLKLRWEKHQLQADKNALGWKYCLQNYGNGEYANIIEYPVNNEENVDGVEKYDTRDALSKDGYDCDMDTVDFSPFESSTHTIYNVAQPFVYKK